MVLLVGLLLTSVTYISAQSPGGVSAPVAWFRTRATGTSLLGSYRWVDLAGDSLAIVARDRDASSSQEFFTLPFTDTESLNFHPALKFTRLTLGKDRLPFSSSLRQGSIITVVAPSGTASSTDSIGCTPRTISYLWAGQPNHSVWGELPHTIISIGDLRSCDVARSPIPIRSATEMDGGAYIEGAIPELIVYNRILTPSERLRVESGLALRYGLTLSGSYLDSHGSLIWDYATNKAYHHRVAGIMRDDAGRLLQPISTTSCREQSVDDNESYHQRNPYSFSSSQRTLVLGRECGSPLSDGSYLIWGDNDEGLSLHPLATDSLWHLLDRRWLVCTNISDEVDTTTSRWGVRGFTIRQDGFTDYLIRKSEDTEAMAVSAPLLGTDGSIELRCPAVFASFDIGYKTSSDEECGYGFRILTPTSIQVIEDGTLRQAPPIPIPMAGKVLLIRKEGGRICLTVDGIGDERLSLSVPNSSTDASYQAVIKTHSVGELSLSDVRLTGTVNTGNMVELSYAQLEDQGRAFFTGQQPLLIIDRTARGGFGTEDIHFIKSAYTDHLRQKIVFRNVVFDEDISGADLFTFGYYDGLVASLRLEDAHCKDDTPLADGRIHIKVELGTPEYTYRLVAVDVANMPPDSVLEGVFDSEEFAINDLQSGVYQLELPYRSGDRSYDFTRMILIGSACGESSMILRRQQEQTVQSTAQLAELSDGSLLVVQDGDLTLTARLRTTTQETVTLMVFDIGGHLLSERTFRDGVESILRETVPTAGVYVVKAVTHSGEYTQRVIIK